MRSILSTSRVTCLPMISATDRGTLMVGSGRHRSPPSEADCSPRSAPKSLSTQLVHLQGRLDGANIQLDMPSLMIKIDDIRHFSLIPTVQAAFLPLGRCW